MLEGLDGIDWNEFQYGNTPIDFPKLIRGIVSSDSNIRNHAHAYLGIHLEYLYENRGPEFPLLVLPYLMELLVAPDLPERLLVTDLLIFILSYCEIETLNEPYKSDALRLKKAVCAGRDVYQSLADDPNITEDIQELLNVCRE